MSAEQYDRIVLRYTKLINEGTYPYTAIQRVVQEEVALAEAKLFEKLRKILDEAA